MTVPRSSHRTRAHARAAAIAGGVVVAVTAWSGGSARAAGPLEDPRAFPEAPRPATLPELTHPDGEATLELTSGVFTPRSTSQVRGHVPVDVLRTALEQPLAARRFFVGAAIDGALAQPETTSPLKPLVGNPEITGRALWATSTGMSFGGGLTFLLPFTRASRTGEAHDVAVAATTLRPWELSSFAEGFFTVRPFFDVRDVLGPFVLQARQALDLAFDVHESQAYRMYAVETLYAGYRVSSQWAVGVELNELYVIEAPVNDARRAFFTASPVLRGMFERVQPELGVVASFGAPYYPGSERMIALRTGLTALW